MRDIHNNKILLYTGSGNEYNITQEEVENIDLKGATLAEFSDGSKGILLPRERPDQGMARWNDEQGVRKTSIHKKLESIETKFTKSKQHLKLDYLIYTLSKKHMNNPQDIEITIDKLIEEHKRCKFTTKELSYHIDAIIHNLLS